ncbi:MAG: hypothetical protein R2941_07460 [Desulfobacterales bacterium]
MITSTPSNSTIEEKLKVLTAAFEIRDGLGRPPAGHVPVGNSGTGQQIGPGVKGDMDKRQREYYLREQMKSHQG